MTVLAPLRPTLDLLNPDGPPERTLLVLHGNDGSPDAMRPLYAALAAQGWRVALACSGQAVPDHPGQFRWNDLNRTDEAIRAWLEELGGMPYWAGFSAGSWVALRAVLTGTLPGRGVLAALPSIPTHPDWWPQGWTAAPARVPCAFLVGETDDLTPPHEARAFAGRLAVRGVPTLVEAHPGGHEHPTDWPERRDRLLAWLGARAGDGPP